MTVRTNMIKEFAQMGFDRLGSSTKNLKPDQLDWKSCTQANTIRWILTHMNEELNIYIPKYLVGTDPTKDWPKEYVGNPNFKIERINADLEKGRRKLYAGLNKLTNEQLDQEVEGFMGKKSREFYLMLMVGEILHHEGQVAAILGVEKRIKGIH
jgi:uncharacterized damage-inducible protein DinB